MTNRRAALKAGTAGARALGFPDIMRAVGREGEIVALFDPGAVFHQGPAQPLLTDLGYRKKIRWR